MTLLPISKLLVRTKYLLYLAAIVIIIAPYLLAAGYVFYKYYYKPDHVIGSGKPDGTYYKLAEKISKLLTDDLKPLQRFSHIASAGSVENIAKLQKGEIDFALSQDGLPNASHVRALARLYSSPMQIIVPTNSAISGLESIVQTTNLAQMRVYLGDEQSGTRVVAMTILNHYGIQTTSFADTGKEWKFEQVFEALENNRLDVAFLLVSIRSTISQNIAKSGKYRLLPIDRADGINAAYPFLKKYSIPSGAFSGAAIFPPNQVMTVSSSELLICSKSVPDHVAYSVVSSLYGNASSLTTDFPLLSELSPLDPLSTLYYKIHPGAEAYYSHKEWPSILGVFSWAQLIAAIGYSFTTFTLFKKAVRRIRSKNFILKLDELVHPPEKGGKLILALGVEQRIHLTRHLHIEALEYYKNSKIDSEDYERITKYADFCEQVLVRNQQKEKDLTSDQASQSASV